MDVEQQMSGNQVEDVSTLASRTICPQSGLVAGDHNFQTIARTAQNVTHQELAGFAFACGKQRGQHGLKPCEQCCANFFSISFPLSITLRNRIATLFTRHL